MNPTPALGKGLAALIPSVKVSSEQNQKYFLCSIDKIIPNRDQPRKLFSKDSLQELSDSIKENGILQPLVVRQMPSGDYELIAGERRLRASKFLGLSEVPVVVLEVSDEKNLELALIENIQRQDLNPIEEALAYKQLIDRHHYTQEECARRLGKERSTVTNIIRLLSLPEEIRSYIVESKLSMGHARALIVLEDEEMKLKVARRIVQEGLSVREVEAIAKRMKEGVQVEKIIQTKVISPQIQFMENEMTKMLGSKVKIKSNGLKGKVVINYQNHEDLEKIFNSISSN